MANQHPWPLSQDANKPSGICSCCFAVRQLHLKDGSVHLHGPRQNPCLGSRKPPLDHSPSNPPSATHQSHPLTQPVTLTCPQTTPSSQQSYPTITHPSINSPVIKHIPKSARPSCCTALSSLLLRISHSPDDLKTWSDLLNFGRNVFSQPPRGGKKHNLASVIKKRADDVRNNSPNICISSSSSASQAGRSHLSLRPDDASSLAARISAKIEDGNIRAAVRIICSEDSLATPDQAALSKLAEKHPLAPIDRSLMHEACSTPQFLVSESEIRKAIRSFPAGSCGGPDGIRPQHISDLINCVETGSSVLTAITAFVNTLLSGKCHPSVRTILFGGTLIALNKKSGGIRPIAIGYVWRRIAAKCANTFALSKLTNYFIPHQLGVSVPGGCEAAIHAARRFTDSLQPGSAVIKLDFVNAFNSLHRDAMLSAVRSFIPEIYEFCFLSYGSPTALKFDTHVISSQEGAQQGDPLGPLLFCLTIHPLLQSLSSQLIIGYLDDITLGGDEQTVAADVALVQAQGEALGLKLNINKCEFINDSAHPSINIFQDFLKLTPDRSMLLGSPLRTGEAMDAALLKRCDDLALAISRMNSLSSHDALILLKSSFSAPKVLHTLRSSPCTGHPSLLKFDSIQRSGLCQITNSILSDTQWLQASHPVSDGGLGIRRVASLASPAFLASAASSSTLQDLILSRCNLGPDASLGEIRSLWSSTLKIPYPSLPLASKQKTWDRPFLDLEKASILSQAQDQHHRARLLAVSAPHAGDWLHTLPISNCGLRLDDECIRVAVGLRLGINLCQPHLCPCGFQVDARGTHGLSCKQSSGRSARHSHLNDLIWRALSRAGIPSAKEPSGLSRSDGKRPDGMSLIPWQAGKNLIWDVTVADSLAPSYLHSTSHQPGAAAENSSNRKEAKYSALARSYMFIPLAFETLGPLGSKAANFISELGRRLSLVSKDHREGSFLFQRISVAIQRFNGVCFRGSFVTPLDFER